MTTHIVLASIFLLSVLLAIIFAIANDNTRFDFTSLIIVFVLISAFSAFATLFQGFEYGDKVHYRERHDPIVKDVNNGYAEIIEYQTIKKGDTILFYDIKWLGNNQDGEREINNK